jgi:hypothetical protein
MRVNQDHEYAIGERISILQVETDKFGRRAAVPVLLSNSARLSSEPLLATLKPSHSSFEIFPQKFATLSIVWITKLTFDHGGMQSGRSPEGLAEDTPYNSGTATELEAF